jgi:glutathione S-transferase
MEKTGKLVLWGCATPRTLRVHWALHELGLDYRCEPIQPRAGGDLNEVTADNQAERAATIRMRKRHWGRTVGRA